jgi:hypothetical protein
MSVFKKSRWQEILDGKKEWSIADRTPEACDLFEVQFVAPLRQLRDEGRIAIEEVSAPSLGPYRIVHIFLREILDDGTSNI